MAKANTKVSLTAAAASSRTDGGDVRRNGSSNRHIEFHYASIADTSLVRFVGRTERGRMEVEVRQSEERLREMANAAPVLIWMSGSERLRNYFNQLWLISLVGRWRRSLARVGPKECRAERTKRFPHSFDTSQIADHPSSVPNLGRAGRSYWFANDGGRNAIPQWMTRRVWHRSPR